MQNQGTDKVEEEHNKLTQDNKDSATFRSSQGTPMYQLTTYNNGTLCPLLCCTEDPQGQ